MHDAHSASYNQDEITLSEIWRAAVCYKLLVFTLPLVAMLIALIVTSLQKPQWEASALIRIGQVPLWPKSRLVEPFERSMERIKLEGFKHDVLKQLGMAADQDDAGKRLYLDKLKVEAVADPDLIKITTRGYSPDQARQFAEATLSELAKQHAILADPYLKRLNDQAFELKKQIVTAEAQRESLKKDIAKSVLPHSSFMEKVILSNIIYQRDIELRNLKETLSKIEDELDPLRTYPTAFLQGTHVGDLPAAPKKSLAILLSGIFGLFAGLFAAFLLNNLRTSEKKPATVNAAA